MKKIITTSILSLISASTFADNTTLELSHWKSKANFQYVIDSSGVENGGDTYGSPTSRLDYTDMESNGLELTLLSKYNGKYSSVSIQYSDSSSDGSMIDDDWISKSYAATMNGPEHILSTKSDANKNESFGFKISHGKKLNDLNLSYLNPNEITLGGSFTYNHSKYNAKGLEILKDPYDIVNFDSGFQGERVISVKNEKYSIGIDTSVIIPLGNVTAINIDARINPFEFFSSTDSHLLRDDLKKDSIKMDSFNYGGDFKIGLNGKLGSFNITSYVNYVFSKNYGDGDADFHFTDGSVVKSKLTDHKFDDFRYGVSISKSF